MAWRTVLITRHSKINYHMNDINVQTDQGSQQIPIDDIKTLIIGTTKSVITAYAINELAKRNVKLIFCNEKGMPVGEFCSYRGNIKQNVNLRKQIVWENQKKENIWQSIVKAKVNSQAQALKLLEREGEDLLLNIHAEIEVNDNGNREAQAARLYFPRLFDKEFVRSDDKNRINAQLDYGYAILLSTVSREIVSAGYISQLGIHHDGWENPFNLASDLMEPFRPLIDKAVYKQKDNELTLNEKIELINVLDEEVTLNGINVDTTQAIQRLVRDVLKYMSGETDELPYLEIELKL